MGYVTVHVTSVHAQPGRVYEDGQTDVHMECILIIGRKAHSAYSNNILTTIVRGTLLTATGLKEVFVYRNASKSPVP